MDDFWLAIGPRQPATSLPTAELAPDLRVALHRADSRGAFRVDVARGVMLVEVWTADAVVAALAWAVRQRVDLAVCLWIGRPRQPAFSASAWLPRAARGVEAVVVGPGELSSARRDGIAGVLRSYLALARSRSSSEWAVIDAVRAARTQSDAARALQCSRQWVSSALRRAHAHADHDAALALALLSDRAPTEAPAAGSERPPERSPLSLAA